MGFHPEGLLRNSFRVRGAWVDFCVCSVLREEWGTPGPGRATHVIGRENERVKVKGGSTEDPPLPAQADSYAIKIVLIGSDAVGKSSLAQRYVDHIFEDRYLTTIGTSVTTHVDLVSLDDGRDVQVKLSIWDIMGNRNVLKQVGDAYFQGARGALAVFDISRPETLEGLWTWVNVARKREPRMPILVVGNKSDLEERRMVSNDEARDFCRVLALPYLPTSAKTGLNVEIAFRHLVQDVLRTYLALDTEGKPAPV